MRGLRVCEALKSDVVSSGFQKHLDNSRKYLGYVFNDRTVELQVNQLRKNLKDFFFSLQHYIIVPNHSDYYIVYLVYLAKNQL